MTDSPWTRFCRYFYRHPSLDLTLDISRMAFGPDFLPSMEPVARQAYQAMAELEAGAIANPDEKRQVGHYWLRHPELAPEAALGDAIRNALADVKAFARDVHQGTLASPAGKPFTDFLLVGIGGSALGPQLTADALGGPGDRLRPHFLDNTDPDGMARVLDGLRDRLGQTLVVVISKSGGTKETRNGMLETIAAFRNAGLPHAPHFVAVTSAGSLLDKTATAEGWRHRFPMWDWVGGRTSVMSTVGLVPMALQGLDIDGFLAGAAEMDAATRSRDTLQNPAMLLALMWHHAGGGRGLRDMVVLPYKDRLVLFSKYLQQLVMESLGKELDLAGTPVHQGLAVYGNKGSTDQHAYVQQLRDGINNFFATFIEVRRATAAAPLEVEPGVTSGDYLQGFLRGTRAALTGNGRESITLSIPAVDARTLGALVALYERAVGFYASLVHINAYHQPGVEAGKKAAGRLLDLQGRIRDFLLPQPKVEFTAANVAAALDCDPEDAYHVLVHLAANPTNIRHLPGRTPDTDRFCALA